MDTYTNQESSNNDNVVYNKSPNFSSHRRTPSDSQIGLHINKYKLLNHLFYS